jgi:phosphoglycolate phosphatase
MRLAVFDCDGTLVDSGHNIVAAMQETFAEHALAPPCPRAVRRVVGLSLANAMQVLLPEADAAFHARLAAAYKASFQRMRAEARLGAEPMYAGLRALIELLRERGWKLAVATGKSDRGLNHVLALHGIAQHFSSLQTADRHPSKPDPAMLLACLAETGVAAEATVIIGDTVFDMHMGAAAGVAAIGVDWGYHPAEDLRAAGAIDVARDAAHLEALLLG